MLALSQPYQTCVIWSRIIRHWLHHVPG
jgi:hypothetical protein